MDDNPTRPLNHFSTMSTTIALNQDEELVRSQRKIMRFDLWFWFKILVLLGALVWAGWPMITGECSTPECPEYYGY